MAKRMAYMEQTKQEKKQIQGKGGNKMKLYEITQEVRGLLNAIEETGEIDAYKDTLEALQLEFEEKADNVACYIKELLAEAEAIKAEEKALAERRKAKENKAERLKAYLLNEMQATGMKKLETTRNVLSIRKTPASVKIASEKTLIEDLARENLFEFLTYKEPTINKNALKEAIKQGQEFEGVELVQGESFSIK